MKYLWVKWMILVWANSVIGLIFGHGFEVSNIPYTLGLILGICVFIPLYAAIERHAQARNNQHLITALTTAMIIRVCTQFLPILDIGAGLLAIDLVDSFHLGFDFRSDYESGEITGNTDINLDGKKLGFLGGLLLTVLTGSILSLIVAFLTVMIMGILTLKNNYFAKK